MISFKEKLQEKVAKVNPEYKKSVDLQILIETISKQWEETLQMYKDALKEILGYKEFYKGEVGPEPDDDRLIELIMPLIPEPVQGEKGDSIVGEKGEPGVDGAPGRDGVDGAVGTVGPEGPEGPAGKDGSPDKPEEIATKLNTLTEAVDMKVIIGLQEMFANMQRAFNKKGSGATGGGGGKWVHQRWATSSATTTLSLDYNIASDGEAHIFRYNGQVQDLGTDYTISGKTITLLFTPDDSTVASIAYVRT